MPTYVCTTRPHLLDERQRTEIARAVSRAHEAATGAPVSFVQVVFEESAHRYIGGAPSDAHIMVRGDIRAGRTVEQRTGLICAIARDVAAITGTALDEVWVYLNELTPTDMVEFGRVLPKPGEEQAWLDALPGELRDRLAALALRKD